MEDCLDPDEGAGPKRVGPKETNEKKLDPKKLVPNVGGREAPRGRDGGGGSSKDRGSG